MATPSREDDLGARLYSLAVRNQFAPGIDQLGTVRAISVETGETVRQHDQRAMTMSLVATGGGLVFGGVRPHEFRREKKRILAGAPPYKGRRMPRRNRNCGQILRFQNNSDRFPGVTRSPDPRTGDRCPEAADRRSMPA